MISFLFALTQQSRHLASTATDERALRADYRTLAEAMRRKDFGVVLRLALSNYRTAGLDGKSRLYSNDVPGLRHAEASIVYSAYRFDLGSLRVEGNRALVQSLETASRRRLVKGKGYGERLWAVHRDLWLKDPSGWRLAATYYPQGYRIYPEYALRRRPLKKP